MAKLTLSDPTNLQNESTFITTIASNNAAIEEAMENTLSRDGTTPNTMSASLDMNSNRIVNLPSPVNDAEPARKVDLETVSIAFADVTGSSTTSVAIGTGSKSFTASTGKKWYAGQFLSITSQANSANYMHGTVTSYSTTTGALVMNILNIGGSGTLADWLINITGPQGAAGAAGANGAVAVSGTPTANQFATWSDATTIQGVSITGLVKGNGASAPAAAVSGTDYCPATTGSSVLKASSGGTAATTTADALTIGTIELGHASDTTISRSSAGVIAVEGVTVPLNSTSSTHTASTIELGHATDTTLSRSAAGQLAIEGGAGSLYTGTIELGAASDTTLSRTAAGQIAVEGTAVALAGKQTIWIPAAAMTARTTNGAATGLVETTTNKNMFRTLDFDTTTQEFAQFEVFFPKSWNLGTVTFRALWSHAATTTNFGVVWGLAGVARSDDDAGDVAFGTAQTSTDTGGTTNDIYVSPESSAITVAGTPTVGDSVQFQLNRTVADGGDTMAIDARLHGIQLFFTTNAATDI